MPANPTYDAEMVAEVLKQTGFEKVTLLENLDKDAVVGALRNFVLEAEKADWAVIYYAGHGMGVGAATTRLAQLGNEPAHAVRPPSGVPSG